MSDDGGGAAVAATAAAAAAAAEMAEVLRAIKRSTPSTRIVSAAARRGRRAALHGSMRPRMWLAHKVGLQRLQKRRWCTWRVLDPQLYSSGGRSRMHDAKPHVVLEHCPELVLVLDILLLALLVGMLR